MQGDRSSTGSSRNGSATRQNACKLTEEPKTGLLKAEKIVADAIAAAEALFNAWTPLPRQATEVDEKAEAAAEITLEDVGDMLLEATPGGAQAGFGLVHGDQVHEAVQVGNQRGTCRVTLNHNSWNRPRLVGCWKGMWWFSEAAKHAASRGMVAACNGASSGHERASAGTLVAVPRHTAMQWADVEGLDLLPLGKWRWSLLQCAVETVMVTLTTIQRLSVFEMKRHRGLSTFWAQRWYALDSTFLT